MARTGAALSVELEMQRTATFRATARRDAIVIAIRGVECFRRRQGQNCKLATAGVAGAMLRRFRTCMSPSLSHSTPRDPLFHRNMSPTVLMCRTAVVLV